MMVDIFYIKVIALVLAIIALGFSVYKLIQSYIDLQRCTDTLFKSEDD